MSSRRIQRGVSLIEVIVALVIISGFGAALFVWAGQTLKSASRAAQVMDDVELDHNISELAASINPALRGQGRLETDTHLFEWTSRVEREPVDHVRHPMGLSPYQVSVFTLVFRVSDKQGQLLRDKAERTVAGYKQARVRPSGPPGFSQMDATP